MYKMTNSKGRLPPVPPGSFIFGNLFELKDQILEGLSRYAKDYGDILRIKAGPRILYFINNADYIKHILQDNYSNYSKRTRGWNKLRPLFGEGLLTSDGPQWLQQRRTMQPGFHHRRIQHFFDLFVKEANALVESWRPLAKQGKAVNVSDEMMGITFRIVTSTLFSEDLKGDVTTVGSALDTILHCASDDYAKIIDFPFWFPTLNHLKAKRALRELDEIVYPIIRKRRESKEPKHDLLSMLMAMRDPETGVSLNDKELRDQIMTIFMTGHETTAVSLAWAWYLLWKHPEIEQRMAQEIKNVFNGGQIQLEDLGKLETVQRVFKETLRLYPPIWVFSRKVIKDDIISGWRIPSGATIFFSPYVMHRNPQVFENPEDFDPDRFTSAKIEPPPPFTYFPFGGGPRLCIGKDFALMEARVLLSIIANTYRLNLVSGHKVETDPTITLRAKYGIMMNLEEKSSRHFS